MGPNKTADRPAVVTSLTLLFVLFNATFSQKNEQWHRLEPRLHALVSEGIDLTLKQEYAKADSVFRLSTLQFPNYPAGYLYQAAVQLTRVIDFETRGDEAQFDSLLDVGRAKAEQLGSSNSGSLWRDYFLATANGYDAYARTERGDWFGGMRKAFSSVSQFELVMKADSSFYDAYVGIGTYYYWKSRKIGFLTWLPFFSDDRTLGIQLLTKGALQCEYNRFAAISALVSIFLDAERYDEAEEWSRTALKTYPGNRIFLWGLATALHKQQKFREATEAYDSLLRNIEMAHMPHPYGEVVCRLNLVKCNLARQDTSNVLRNLETILSYERTRFPEALEDRAKAKFKDTKEILLKLKKKSSN